MSVFKRPGTPFYRYNFIVKGQRFSGTTERTARRDAELVERDRRAEAVRMMGAAVPADAPMTVDEACGRYWDEVGQHAADWRQVDWTMKWVVPRLGADTPLRDITNDDVARIVAERRLDPVSYPKSVQAKMRKAAENGQKRPKGAREAPSRRVSPSTVNRSVTQPLRRVMKRAAELWGEPVKPIRWRDHMLGEPTERVRYMTAEEEAAVIAILPENYQRLVAFAIGGGCRAGECIRLTWADIEWGELRIRITGKAHRGVKRLRTLPMTADMRDMLWAMRPAGAPLDAQVFRNESGDPATYRSYSQAFKRACQRAGVTGLRVHDLRHTAATRILLTPKGNLRAAQRLLGHSSVATTAKYAHMLDDDVRAAMTEVSQKSHQQVTPAPANPLINKG